MSNIVDPDIGEMLALRRAADLDQHIRRNNHIAGRAADVTSKGGANGVIDAVLATLGIADPAWCVEFGACDGFIGSNTAPLIDRGWNAVMIEANDTFFAQLKARRGADPRVICLHRSVGTGADDGLDAILESLPIPTDFALLSVDIDGNDYHVWSAIRRYRPRLVIVEFTKLVHPDIAFTPSAEPPRQMASIRSLCELGREKGYELVAVEAWNLYFVRAEDFHLFGIADNRPAAMFNATEESRLFQHYDGTLRLYGNDLMYWQYQIDAAGERKAIRLSQRDIQVLPDGLRVFRPRHTYDCEALSRYAGSLDAARVPANRLLVYRANETSECGEDGIIAHLLARLGIGKGFLVDVGANDGIYLSNTRSLLLSGWSGLLVECDPEAFAHLRNTYRSRRDVVTVEARVERSGPSALDALLRRHGSPAVDLLCIDVEGNDYHLWSSLTAASPRIVVLDFNPSIANDTVYVQAYDSPSPAGASLLALNELAARLGYVLAATTDWNAVFVHADAARMLGLAPPNLEGFYVPPFEMRMTQTLDGGLHLLACRTLMRQDYEIAFEDFQALPRGLRRWRVAFGDEWGKLVSVFYDRERSSTDR